MLKGKSAFINGTFVIRPPQNRTSPIKNTMREMVFIFRAAVLFTNAFDLHQLTNPIVFQNKPNPEGRFSAALGHVFPLGRR